MQNRNNDEKWIGQKFGRLTVVGFERKTGAGRGWNWVVKCDCGNQKVCDASAVKSGNTRSCGCLHDELCGQRARKYKYKVYENKRLHGIWVDVKRRCYSPSRPRYKDYGGRGITVCEEWLQSFDNFVEWALANGYDENLTLERKDVNGNYCPENCEWITLRAQCRNKRDTIYVEYRGETYKLIELCKQAKVSYYTVHNRLQSGWSVEDAIDTPSVQENSLMKKCRERNMNYQAVRDRIMKLGWTEERALSTPILGRGANQETYGFKWDDRKCAVCGDTFSPKNFRQKYCSPKCHAESKHAWYKKKMQERG